MLVAKCTGARANEYSPLFQGKKEEERNGMYIEQKKREDEDGETKDQRREQREKRGTKIRRRRRGGNNYARERTRREIIIKHRISLIRAKNGG